MRSPLAALALIASAAIAQGQSVERKTYPIRGTTAPDLLREMKQHGPHGFWAWTQADYKWRYTWNQQSGQCVVTGATVTETMTMTLPEWANRSGANACLQGEWERMLARLIAHENGHVLRWRLTRANIERAIRNTPPHPTCDALARAMDSAAKGEIERTLVDQRKYDSDTDHGRREGVALKGC